MKIANGVREDEKSAGFVIWEAETTSLSAGSYMVVFTSNTGQKSVARLMK